MTEKKLVLITGGARSGKSSFAVQLASRLGERVLYIATAEVGDPEMEARIIRHRNSRPAGWKTVEVTGDLAAALAKTEDADVVLIECLTLLVNNLLMRELGQGPWEAEDGLIDGEEAENIEKKIAQVLEDALNTAKNIRPTVIMVTNEVGFGIVPPYSMGRFYRDLMGTVNQQVAMAADEVYFTISGIPTKVKG